jgi:putative oxidoreductase
MNAAFADSVRVLFGGLMAIGGVMHFTTDERIWESPLLNAMADSGFLWREIGIVNLLAGIALIVGRYPALAALALAPISLNIFLFHLWRLDVWGLTIGVPVLVLNAIVLFSYRSTYRPLLERSPSSVTPSRDR